MTQTDNVRKLANDLAHRYQNGEKDALGELYPLLIPYMVHKARRSGAGDNAWDIAHDAFLRLATRLADKENPVFFENVLAYATTATHRITLNMLRKGRRSAIISIDSHGLLQSIVVDESQWPEAIVSARLGEQRRRAVLTEALLKLAPCHRQVIRMHHIHGMKHAEIQEVLRISAETVIARLRRARVQLRNVLKDELGG